MRVLVVGGGGREHALCWKLAQSPVALQLFCAPGNPGIARVATCVPIAVTQLDAIVAFAVTERIELVVVGPEAPLVDGLADRLRAAGVRVFGCSQAAATIEGSKVAMKQLAARHQIPTAAFGVFTDLASADRFVDETFAAPQVTKLVVKADGLAAGKGVIICESASAAKQAARTLIGTGGQLVIEEFLVGREASLLAFVAGEAVVPFDGAEDHKALGDGDRGPMTGGMGTISPTPTLPRALHARSVAELVVPAARALAAEGRPFYGLLFAGVMVTARGPLLLEFNCRFGDPETQSLLRRFDGDLLPSLMAVADGAAPPAPRFSSDAAIAVVMASAGYPESARKGDPITGLDAAEADPAVVVFHAGTALAGEQLVTAGGRVLAVSATGATLSEARRTAYAAVQKISFPGAQVRSDIGDRDG